MKGMGGGIPKQGYVILLSESEKRTLARLDLSTLIDKANDALESGNYEEAVLYLRTAVRRAPFRQDLRAMLIAAVEDRVFHAEQDQGPRPVPRSTRPPLFEDDSDETGTESGMEEVPLHERKPPRESRRGRDQALKDGQRRSVRAPYFGRARRGPVSALVAVAVAGFCMISIAGGTVWFYLDRGERTEGREEKPPEIPAIVDAKLIEEAEAFEKRNRFDLAIEKYNLLSDVETREKLMARCHARRAGVYRKGKKHDKARESYELALQHDPGNAEYAFELGCTYYMLGRTRQGVDPSYAAENFDLAEKYLKKARTLEPERASALYYMAKVEIARSDPLAASDYFRRIIRSHPDSKDATQARKELIQMGINP